jgi:chromosome transmission fidelity protein 1
MRYRARLKAKNIVYIDQIVYILDSFKRILQETIVNPQTHTEQCQLFGLTEFMLKFKIDNINMFKVLNYCKKSQISKKLNGFVERYLTEDIIPTRDDVKCGGAYSDGLVLKSPLMLIEQFIQSLTTPDKDCRIAVKRTGFDTHSSLKYLLLNPSIHFIDVVNETRAIILAGGTMQPLSQFKTQLFPSVVSSSDLIEFSCGHVIPPDHLLPVVMTCGPSSKMFDFTYNNRQNPALIDELGQCLYNLCSIVPGGVVCFFPSYDYEKVVYKKWEESGLLDRLLKKKQIFREPKMVSQVQMILSRYAESIRNSNTITKTNTATETTLSNEVSTATTTTGGVLLCVVGGKLSEGINFSDDLGRCVVMVGLPYPNKKSPELAEKLAYLDATLPRDPTSGRLPSQLHYENLCMKGVNQSIGRAIRHINDYATIVLLDNRYSNKAIYSMLPQWISSNLLISNSFGSGFGAIRKVK